MWPILDCLNMNMVLAHLHPKHSTWPLTCTNDCYLVKNPKIFIGTFRILTHYSPLLLFYIPWKQETFPVFRGYRKATPGCNELRETSKAKYSNADIRQGSESASVVWFLFLWKKKWTKLSFQWKSNSSEDNLDKISKNHHTATVERLNSKSCKLLWASELIEKIFDYSL